MTVDLAAASSAVGEALPDRPELLLVLGSGLSGLAERVDSAVEMPFGAVPGYPEAGVAGHAGRYVAGRIEGRPVLIQAGRFHTYEGHDMDVVVAPIRVAAALGVGTVILTNAAGGIARGLQPGSIMLIDDHINLQWRSALAGPLVGDEQRFPDMSEPYDRDLQALSMQVASDLRMPLFRGTYAAVAGPSFETPAEVRMLEFLGADAVGMSTVPETTVARALGLRVLAFSMISNRAAGIGGEDLDHAEVLETGKKAGAGLEALIRGVVRRMES
ncbi:MAG: purine nucleoside phosphorylase I, inosine and guanosine-specific [Gemmatimonadota bacterium]|nr:MAG: purine nucleoside phosphorylase I, inosine and guanosine-specific [Gemmatimonadota bacterium]